MIPSQMFWGSLCRGCKMKCMHIYSCLSDCLILGRLEGSYTIRVQSRGAGYPVRSFVSVLFSRFHPHPSLPRSLFHSLFFPPPFPPSHFLLLSPSLLFSQLLNISFLCIYAHTWGDHCYIDRTDVCQSVAWHTWVSTLGTRSDIKYNKMSPHKNIVRDKHMKCNGIGPVSCTQILWEPLMVFGQISLSPSLTNSLTPTLSPTHSLTLTPDPHAADISTIWKST